MQFFLRFFVSILLFIVSAPLFVVFASDLPPSAAEPLKESPTENPEIEALKREAEILRKQRAEEQVIRETKEAERLQQEDLKTIYKNAEAAFKNLEYDAAFSLFSVYVNKVPDDPKGYDGLGQAASAIGRYDIAARAYVQLTDMYPENAEYYVALAHVYTRADLYPNAIAVYKKMIPLFPGTIDYTVDLGLVYMKAKLYKDAVDLFSEIITQHGGKTPTDIYNLRGSCYMFMGSYSKAVADFTVAIRRSPDVPSYYYNRGRAYLALGKRKEAEADLEKVDYLKDIIDASDRQNAPARR